MADGAGEKPGWISDSVCYALYKPRGMLTSNKVNPRVQVEHRRGCMGAWEQEISAEVEGRRVFHVGRLDKKTSGLIFVTSVGHFGRFICTPGMLPKEYIATTERPATEEQMQRMRDGFELHDGFAKAVEVELLEVRREQRVVTKGNVRKNPKEKKARAQRKKERQQQEKVRVLDSQQPSEAEEDGGASPTDRKRKFDAITASDGVAAGADTAAPSAESPAAAAPDLGNGAPSITPNGVDNDDDDDDAPITVEKVTCRVRIVLNIGRWHIVKRMMHHVGLPVTSLHRTAIGPVSLASLGLEEAGVHRRLTQGELETLWGGRCQGKKIIDNDEEGEDEN